MPKIPAKVSARLVGLVLLSGGCTGKQTVQFKDPCSIRMVTGEAVGVYEFNNGLKAPRVRYLNRDHILLMGEARPLGWKCEDVDWKYGLSVEEIEAIRQSARDASTDTR